ncbi:MAG: hypothetical protein GTO46_05745 [Gemmatimonadetes bacterium]|nr:hypothetical protein [Gemmatimonadota bacterium]
MNRWLGAEIYLIHFGHGVLYLVVLAIVAVHVPWWALLAGAPLVLLSAAFWLYEASFVLPPASRMLRGQSGVSEEAMTATATTTPRGDGAVRRDDGTSDDNEEMRGNRWRI